MARVNITIPDEVLAYARAAGLNISAVTAAALIAELERRSKIAALDAYLDGLDDELGPVSAEEAAAASAWADRIESAGAVSVASERRSPADRTLTA